MPPPQLQYVTINDFSPGIQQRVNRTGATVAPSNRIAADVANTYRCIALPGGGLGPLPINGQSYLPAPPALPSDSSLGAITVTGFFVAGNVYVTPVTGLTPSEFHFGYEWVNSTAHVRHFVWSRHRMWETTPTITILKTINSTEVSPVNNFRRCWFMAGRADPSNPLNPGVPIVYAAWYVSTGALEKFWSVYPSPSSPGTDTVVDVSTSLAVDYMFAHQNRSVIFEQKPWLHGSVGAWAGDEQVWFTNVNLVTVQPTVAQVYGQETYGGYNFGISTNANEALFVKVHGGGYVVRGDLSGSNTIVHLPSLAGAGLQGVTPAWCPAGLVYVSSDGANLWAGGEQSQAISYQLENNFWDVSTGTVNSTAKTFLNLFLNSRGECTQWGDWVVMPNNWLYDYRTNSWWRLEDPTVFQGVWWQTDWNGTLWGALPYNDGVTPVARSWDKTTAARSFSWQSEPIPVTMDRDIVIREVLCTAQGNGTVTITVTGLNGATTLTTMTYASSIPVKLRANMDDVHATHCQIQIVSNGGSNPAPVVYEVALGYHDAATIPSQSS